MSDDESFMRQALEQAGEAGSSGEVPIGAVIVRNGRVIGRGRNQPIGATDPTAHAEVVALREAARTVGNYRLSGATMYVTLEPCLMCVGASLHARLQRLVFGASDSKVGAASLPERLAGAGAEFNHRIEVVGGVLERESAALIAGFFETRR